MVELDWAAASDRMMVELLRGKLDLAATETTDVNLQARDRRFMVWCCKHPVGQSPPPPETCEVWLSQLGAGKDRGLLTAYGFRLCWQKPQLRQVDDLGRVAIGAAGCSLERGSDLRMLWKMLGHHEQREKEVEYALKSQVTTMGKGMTVRAMQEEFQAKKKKGYAGQAVSRCQS